MRFLGFLGLSVALAACAADASSTDASSEDVKSTEHAALQMNDVSIVLPLAKTAKELDEGYVKADDLLPKELYKSATGFPVEQPAHVPVGSDVGLVYTKLRAVAFRFDPCFAQIGPITDEAACDNQLRIVFQALTYTPSGTGAADGAIHAFYKLTREELRSALDEVAAARGNKELGPLQAHPLVVEQGLLGAESKALQAIVKKHASTKNLFRFTAFVSGNLQTVWHFNGFDIANGKATPMEIPTLPAGTTNVTYFAGFGASLSGDFTPATTSQDNMQLLGNYGKAKDASKADQQKALDAAFAIQNPAKHSPNTIDCASCHLAGPGAAITGARDLKLSLANNPNAFVPPASVPAADLKQVTPPSLENGLNVHAFSYRNDELMVSQRVINETASVVAYLNGAK
jgi:hypothetical protein